MSSGSLPSEMNNADMSTQRGINIVCRQKDLHNIVEAKNSVGWQKGRGCQARIRVPKQKGLREAIHLSQHRTNNFYKQI